MPARPRQLLVHYKKQGVYAQALAEAAPVVIRQQEGAAKSNKAGESACAGQHGI
jgi:hypothetical protein